MHVDNATRFRELNAQVASLQADLEQRGAELELRLAERQAIADELALMRGSRSWRITAPLRSATGPRLRAIPGRLARRVLQQRHARDSNGRLPAPPLSLQADPAQLVRNSALFDSAFYLATNPEVAASGIDPVRHYINTGAAEGRDPNPLFDTTFYRRESPEPVRHTNPLVHYATEGAAEGRSPNPHFDTAAYVEDAGAANLSGSNPLAHFLKQPGVAHVLGRLLRNRKGQVDWTDYRRQLVRSMLCYTNSRKFNASSRSNGPRVLVVSHDAALNGAQLLSLSIVRELVTSFGAQVYVLLKKGGLLTPDFLALAPAVTLLDSGHLTIATEAFDDIIDTFDALGVDLAICNTALTGDVAERLKRKGMTVVSAIHELPSALRVYGTPRLLEQAYANSDQVVFASQVVHDKLAEAFAITPESVHIQPQGLYEVNPFLGERRFARLQLKKRLGIPPEAAVVLGCGLASQRKGFDLFIQIARTIRQRKPYMDIHYVWVGGVDGSFTSWCLADVANCDLTDRVHLTGEQRHAGLYYAAADVFVLPSREDPFPTVCLEAMEAGLPVVAFQQAGGIGEALRGDAGILVPYLDVERMSSETLALLENPEKQSELGARGKQRVHDSYQPSQYVKFLLSLRPSPCIRPSTS